MMQKNDRELLKTAYRCHVQPEMSKETPAAQLSVAKKLASDTCVSLYLHIPFCVQKCRYCDFLSGPSDAGTRTRYLYALAAELTETGELIWEQMRECDAASGQGQETLDLQRESAGKPWQAQGGRRLPVDTVFIGGGTPSVLRPDELEILLQTIRQRYDLRPDAEITMECNPGTAGLEQLRAFRKLGVNRISIGVQSFQDEELQLLGRIHTARQARDCVQNARKAGFANVSLDLMSALPGQSYETWMENLQEAVRLSPEHISAYSLILEEGTAFWNMQERGELPPFPDDELDRRMYHDTLRFLEQHGYHRYEISNYAREGCESRHNSGYWTGHPYLGFGVGAASYLGGYRWSHTRDLVRYCESLERCAAEKACSCAAAGTGNECAAGTERNDGKDCTAAGSRKTSRRSEESGILQDDEQLTRQDQMAEFMFLGLRRMEGVSEELFRERFGVSMEEVYGKVLKRYTELGLLNRGKGKVALTEQGIDVSNGIMADFLM